MRVFDSLSVDLLKACVFSRYLSVVNSRSVVNYRSVVKSRSAINSGHSVGKFPARKNKTERIRAFWSMVPVGSVGGFPTQVGK